MPVLPPLRSLAVPVTSLALLAVGFAGGALTVHRFADDRDTDAPARTARPACPPSEITSTRAQRERAEDCATTQRVTSQLREFGYRDVHVVVSRTDSDSLLGPAQRVHVLAQVAAPERDSLVGDPLLVQRSVAATAGTAPDLVEVVDESGDPLSTGSSGPSSPPSTPHR